jgi:alpha-D-ribose 1-methylphosphonate 5-triphosphate synthase subunit PhnG
MSSSAETPAIETARRQKWMAVLSRASAERLEAGWQALDAPPAYDLLRRPETGMVMVRGRSGGTGPKFNLGEMTVTRCVVRLAGGTMGHGYVAGRDRRRAELAAVFDALLQDPATHPAVMRSLVVPVEAELAAAEREAREKAAATKVRFFTMVRGE